MQWQLLFEVGGKSNRLLLGDVDAFTIPESREHANAAQAMLRARRGIPTMEWFRNRRIKTGKIVVPATPSVDPRSHWKWTYDKGREGYLAEVQRTLSPATHSDYRSMLRLPDLAELEKRTLPTITVDDLTKIVNRVHASGRESSAEHLVRVLKPFWKWLALAGQAKNSSVMKGAIDELVAPARSRGKMHAQAKYVPALAELARIIAVARSGAVDPQIGCALELLVWTVQRRRAIASATTMEFFSAEIDDRREGYWQVEAGKNPDDEPQHLLPFEGLDGPRNRQHVSGQPALRRALLHAEEPREAARCLLGQHGDR